MSVQRAAYVKLGEPRKQALTVKRLEGWSIIDKITPFVHAVGCVSGGRGSAILVSLPEVSTGDGRGVTPGRRRQWSSPSSFSWKTEADDGMASLDPPPSLAVLLTTSSVLPSREAADGLSVAFMEQPIVGTAVRWGREPRPFSVKVRSDIGFVTSAAAAAQPLANSRCASTSTSTEVHPEEDVEEEVGYVLTYCEVYPSRCDDSGIASSTERQTSAYTHCRHCSTSVPSSTSSARRGSKVGRNPSATSPAHGQSSLGNRNVSDDDDLRLIRPLPLPLLLSALPPVRVDDVHLIVTHVDGAERHYVMQRVSAVFADYCIYADDITLAGEFSSGGPAFNVHGDFIGLQHRFGSDSIGMFTPSIVRHMFEADTLGICRTPISSLGLHQQNVEMDVDILPERFNQPLSILQPSCVMDVGEEGTHLIDFKALERARKLRERPVPTTELEPSYEAVYKEFYRDFRSLTHMLHAFPYCPPLTEKVLLTMINQTYRADLQTVATMGGVGVILEIIDGHPTVETLVTAALTALSRMCLYESNQDAFVHMGGATTVVEILKEYPHKPLILQWGTYCLVHVTDPDAVGVQGTVDLLLRCSIVEVTAEALRVHGGTQFHLARWLCQLLTHVIKACPRAVTLLVQADLPLVLLELLRVYRNDARVLTGLLFLVCEILRVLRTSLPVCGEASALLPAELEDLRAFAVTSPLGVSAYFMSQSFAQLEEGELQEVLKSVLRRESQEAYNNASAEMLSVCLEVMEVLLRWKLLCPADCVSILRQPCSDEDRACNTLSIEAYLHRNYAAATEVMHRQNILARTLEEVESSARLLGGARGCGGTTEGASTAEVCL